MTGPALRDLRATLALSASHLATLLGVDVRTIFRWEAATSQPTRLHAMVLTWLGFCAARASSAWKADLKRAVLLGTLSGLGFLLAPCAHGSAAAWYAADGPKKGRAGAKPTRVRATRGESLRGARRAH